MKHCFGIDVGGTTVKLGLFLENAYYINMDTKFALAELGNDAGICGAAKLVMSE